MRDGTGRDYHLEITCHCGKEVVCVSSLVGYKCPRRVRSSVAFKCHLIPDFQLEPKAQVDQPRAIGYRA